MSIISRRYINDLTGQPVELEYEVENSLYHLRYQPGISLYDLVPATREEFPLHNSSPHSGASIKHGAPK